MRLVSELMHSYQHRIGVCATPDLSGRRGRDELVHMAVLSRYCHHMTVVTQNMLARAHTKTMHASTSFLTCTQRHHIAGLFTDALIPSKDGFSKPST